MSRKKKNQAKHNKPSNPFRKKKKQNNTEKSAKKFSSKRHRGIGDSRGRFEQKFKKFEKTGLKASVDKNPKGFAFLVFEAKGRPDAYVPPYEAERLFQGDRVEVYLDSQGRPTKIKILERRMREVVGRFMPYEGKRRISQGWVIFEKKRAHEEIFLPQVASTLRAGEWIRVKLSFHEKGEFLVTGEILEVYGKELPPSADIPMVAAEYGLSEAHSQAAIAEAENATLDLLGSEEKRRTDLRHLDFITIDGETARDFDDAVYVQKVESRYLLWVAIADVSHYVTVGSALDQEARSRGTSVYFPEKAFHMLPRALSENLCSLKPNEPRFALVAKIELDQNAKRINTELMEAIIQSKRRATYNQIQAEWEQNQDNLNWEYRPHYHLFQALRKMRIDRGSIDFELPEAEILANAQGEVISIKNRARLSSHRLIEEFMIAANEAVTEWMMRKEFPFIYRIHDEPSFASLEKFQALAATVGVNYFIEKINSPKIMADLVASLDGHPAQTLLNMALLRSMKQAVYSPNHGIHFGLASPGYTHFTSPIRRYPDLVVHRLIRMVLRNQKKKKHLLNQHQKETLEKDLTLICDQCSYRERLAADAERESIKIKQVRLIARYLGDDFDGKIVGMISSGMFIQLDDPYVEGLVSLESMKDDFYEYQEEKMIIFGRRKKRTFKIGDRVRVKVVRTDLDRRQIDFVFL